MVIPDVPTGGDLFVSNMVDGEVNNAGVVAVDGSSGVITLGASSGLLPLEAGQRREIRMLNTFVKVPARPPRLARSPPPPARRLARWLAGSLARSLLRSLARSLPPALFLPRSLLPSLPPSLLRSLARSLPPAIFLPRSLLLPSLAASSSHSPQPRSRASRPKPGRQ